MRQGEHKRLLRQCAQEGDKCACLHPRIDHKGAFPALNQIKGLRMRIIDMINAVGNRLDPVAIFCCFDEFTFYGKSPFWLKMQKRLRCADAPYTDQCDRFLINRSSSA